MINDASVVIGGGNWGIKEADVLGYKLINDEYYAREIDFANSTAAGTYTDSTGVVRKAPYNLAQYSEMFSDASWVKVGSTINPNVATAPNGTLTADKLIEDTALSTHLVLQLPAGSISGNIYTFSFYAKAAERFNVSAVNNAAGGGQATYNLNTGVVTFTSGISASMQLVGDGWYRCILTYSPTVTGNFNTHIRLANSSGANTYQGDGISGAFIWGAQLVEGTEALPYFPTTTRLNVPRIDYRNADGSLSTTGRLLLEPQRTNGIIYSEAFTYWYAPADGVTLTPNTTDTVSPDGTNNASKIQIVGGNKRSYEITLSSAGAGTFSLFVKAGTSTNIAFFTSSASLLVSFNLTTQVITATTGTGTITSYGNGWLRITASGTLVAGEVIQLLYSGSAGQTLYIWGAQVEAGAYATSYIPTLGAAVTRGADACSKTGISSLIGQTEGTLFVDFVLNNYDTIAFIPIILTNTSADQVYFLLEPTGQVYADFYFNSAFNARISTSTGFLVKGTRYKMALVYKENDFAFYINGQQIGTDNSGIVRSMTSAYFVYPYAGGYGPSGNTINQALLFKTRLTNASLAELTSL